jgi:RNase P protein component
MGTVARAVRRVIRKEPGKLLSREMIIARLREQIAQMDHESILERLNQGMSNIERELLISRLVEGTRG